MMITPFAALVPYIAAAEASFNTVKDSMSFALIKLRGLLPPAIPPLSSGTPSITIKGSLLALNEDHP
jgi:hypothetical protein